MWKKFSIWYTIISSALILVLCIFLFKDCSNSPEVIEIIKNDTIVVNKNDTIFKDRIKYVTTIDTAIVFQCDSIIDTIYVTLPDEHKEATFKKSQDSIDLEAKIQYHGYKAEIDSVEFAYKLHYTQELPKSKPKKIGLVLNIGPYIGYGINFNNGQYYFSPEVGVGVSIGIGGIIK